MIEHLTVHIGHQKTGTSSLQATFYRNAALLASHGLHYMERPTHHAVARHHEAVRRQADDHKELKRFLSEAKARSWPQGLLSSEAFTRLSDEEAAEFVGTARTVARRVSVLLYVRHPVSFVSSSASQGLRMGRTLAEIGSSPRVLPIRAMVARWRGLVGAENMTVRGFASSLLVNGDIIDDVLQVLGLSHVAPELDRVRSNEAFSVLGIHLLDRARILKGRDQWPAPLLDVFGEVPGPKFVLPQRVLDAVAEACVPELDFLRDEFGIVLPEPKDVPSDPPQIDEAALRALALLLYELGLTRAATVKAERRRSAERAASRAAAQPLPSTSPAEPQGGSMRAAEGGMLRRIAEKVAARRP